MATAPDFNDPALNARDLGDEKLTLAYEEGHDADIPSNAGVYHPDGKGPLAHESDLEKGVSQPGSSAGEIPASTGDAEEKEAEAQDPNVVWWDEPADQDPQNPMNWSEGRKWGNIAILSIMTLIT